MSLVPLALRIITVKALTNATLAGARVFDSALEPVDQKSREEAAPVIVVYTDDDKLNITGRDFLNGERELQLTLEFACAQQVNINVDGDTVPAFEIPHTDAGLEVSLNLMRRQAFRVLLTDQGPWARLWRSFALAPSTALARRGAGADKGTRYAAQQVIITTETLSEPAFGKPAEGVWLELLAALDADPDPGLKQLAKIIRAEIEIPSLPEWRSAIAELGVNAETGDAIGIVPVLNPTNPEDSAVKITGATVETGGESWPLDEQSIGEALGPESS
ncbi:hypothetical protein [Brucella intermedia]|uniref:Uncharacterized protein n=1 Tax=Brucella intermedia M86 TaxID=1234597 RepID=M5K2A8_9HYPH|nr:hypothetical protein [Brucella intermedia]ELT51014.1 hypothetical protein D584_01433 [Brucella intermedia M86]